MIRRIRRRIPGGTAGRTVKHRARRRFGDKDDDLAKSRPTWTISNRIERFLSFNILIPTKVCLTLVFNSNNVSKTKKVPFFVHSVRMLLIGEAVTFNVIRQGARDLGRLSLQEVCAKLIKF